MRLVTLTKPTAKSAWKSTLFAARKQQAASKQHARNGQKSELRSGASDLAENLVIDTYGCEVQSHKVWECHSDKYDAVVWQQFWDSLVFFVDNMDEINWDGRLNDYNHCPLYPFLVTLLGDTFPVGSIGGLLNDVLHQPKYADEVFKLLLLVDHLGQYRWVGGLACGVRSDTRILKECGPEIKQYKKAETALLDGGFPGRAHGVIPYPKPKKATLRKWCAQYNDGHIFIRGRGEHPFTQLYTWGVCREVFQKRGLDLDDRIQRLYMMVHAVVHIQQFVNKRNLRYQPYGPWGHFPEEIFDQSEVEPDTSSSEDSSTSAISQVMRMTLVALMILVTTMPRLLIVITIGLVSFSFR